MKYFLLPIILFLQFNLLSQDIDTALTNFYGDLNLNTTYNKNDSLLKLNFVINIEKRPYNYYFCLFPKAKTISFNNDTIKVQIENHQIQRWNKNIEYYLSLFYMKGHSFDGSIVEPGILFLKLDKNKNYTIIFSDAIRLAIKDSLSVIVKLDVFKDWSDAVKSTNDVTYILKASLLKITDYIVKHYYIDKNGTVYRGERDVEKYYEDKIIHFKE